VTRPLRYSINVTSDGCCDQRAIVPDEDLHRHAAEADAFVTLAPELAQALEGVVAIAPVEALS
jgi:hypothetical protein